jgi:hypothetical protein
MHLVRSQVPAADLDSRISGQLPPLPPSLFFWRDELVGEVLDHVQERKHFALIRAGSIGKPRLRRSFPISPPLKSILPQADSMRRLNRFLSHVAEVVDAIIFHCAPLASPRSFFLSYTHALLLVLDNAEHSRISDQGWRRTLRRSLARSAHAQWFPYCNLTVDVDLR